MRRLIVVIMVSVSVGLGGLTYGAAATNVGDKDGCTPGYWKVQQHWDSWEEAAPTDLFRSHFSGATSATFTNLTMVDALKGGGGSGVAGAELILARAAAAAFLNATHEGLAFPWQRWGSAYRPALVATVNAALASGDRETMLDLAAWLDADNNLGCPLS